MLPPSVTNRSFPKFRESRFCWQSPPLRRCRSGTLRSCGTRADRVCAREGKMDVANPMWDLHP